MTEKQIDEMVSRFLGWKLPHDFSPDAGILFNPSHPHNSPHWPVGTNLLTADQAKDMIRNMLDANALRSA